MINKDRLVKTFLDLVQIASPSGYEDAVATELGKRLADLGAEVKTDSYGNVIGRFAGTGDAWLLNAHMDTVSPGEHIAPKIDGDKITSDGTTVLGGDPKAGVAAILEAITSAKEDGTLKQALEVVFTREEETALLGAVNLDYRLVSAKQGVTFDGEEGVQNITISAPGYYQVNAEITGRGAHAGAAPEKGISAIRIASEIIAKLPLGRIDEETTTNIGLIAGGSARNAVPENVSIKGEIRSRDKDKLEQYADVFRKTFDTVMKAYPNAKLDLEIVLEFGPYQFEENHPVIQKVSQILKNMDLKPHLEESGGGTDVNIFHLHGIEAVCVGTGDYDAHTKREYVLISEMLQTAEFCEKLITQ